MRRLKDILDLRREAETIAASLPALMMAAEKTATNVTHGAHDRRKSGAGEKFWQYRPYAEGDRPQDIDWRQSAKNDHVFIRQREWQTTQRTYFWCASDKGMSFSSRKSLITKRETAQIISLALAMMMTWAEETIGLFGEPKTGRGEPALKALGQAFLSSAGEALPETGGFLLPANANLVLIGDFLSPINNIRESFSSLSGRAANALIIQILDPSEIDLNFSGRIRFEGNTAQEHDTIDSVADIRAAYTAKIETHIQAVSALCQENGWVHILHRTDEAMEDTLSALLALVNAAGGKSV